MLRIVAVILGYFIGCINFAYLIGHFKEHIDIREYGSKNSGTTNAIRVMGWKLGGLTFVGDLLKSVVAYYIMYQWAGQSATVAIYAGLGVILGHNWPVFLKFKGGKGIASTLGLIYAVDFRAGIMMMLIMALIIFLTKYVSVGSLFMAVFMPVLFYVFQAINIEIFMVSLILMLLAIYQHRANIRRLINGNENKLGKNNKK
jgi:glycerol-3-phosphate acyltransferase PlsY